MVKEVVMKRGLITVITGNGKGKTTSAIGRAIDAVDRGLKVFIAFFLKGKKFDHGEFKTLARIPGITFKSYGNEGWIEDSINDVEFNNRAQQAMNDAREAMLRDEYGMIILDEINVITANDIISTDTLINFIKSKPPTTELILTGQKADKRVIELADSVYEYLMIKHPFTVGQKARKGIDY